MKEIFKKWYNEILIHRWELGFIENPIYDIIEGQEFQIKYVKFPFERRWYADPFILEYNDEEIVLLVEDFSDTDQNGKISKLVIDRKTMVLKDVKIILELDTHLSFPIIIRKEDKIYIYPENSAAHTLDLYEYDRESDECIKIRHLSSESLADAVISDVLGKKMLFATKDNGNVLDIYQYDEANGSFVFSSNVVFNENIARNAGDFFECDRQLYRASQECNFTYGHALSIQRISKDGDVIKMEEVRRIMPPKHAIGIHTLNVYKDLTVVDIKVFRHPWIALPLFKIRNLFKKKGTDVS